KLIDIGSQIFVKVLVLGSCLDRDVASVDRGVIDVDGGRLASKEKGKEGRFLPDRRVFGHQINRTRFERTPFFYARQQLRSARDRDRGGFDLDVSRVTQGRSGERIGSGGYLAG